MFCLKCGKEVITGSQFCPNCGEGLAINQEMEQPLTPVTEDPITAQDVATIVNNGPQSSDNKLEGIGKWWLWYFGAVGIANLFLIYYLNEVVTTFFRLAQGGVSSSYLFNYIVPLILNYKLAVFLIFWYIFSSLIKPKLIESEINLLVEQSDEQKFRKIANVSASICLLVSLPPILLGLNVFNTSLKQYMAYKDLGGLSGAIMLIVAIFAFVSIVNLYYGFSLFRVKEKGLRDTMRFRKLFWANTFLYSLGGLPIAIYINKKAKEYNGKK